MDTKTAILFFFVDGPVFERIVVFAAMLHRNVSQTIPLRAALRIESHRIIVAKHFVWSTLQALLKINDLVCKGFSANETFSEGIQGQIQLYRDTSIDLCDRVLDKVEAWVARPAAQHTAQVLLS